METLKVLEYINTHPEWKKELSEKPYCLQIKEDAGFIKLNYNQIESDFHEEIVRECRGITLHESSKDFLGVFCFPFTKFFNYGESLAAEIDWDSAVVQEKIDGSLGALWSDPKTDKWRISTNGTIDAFKAGLPLPGNDLESFGDLFLIGIEKYFPSFEEFIKNLEEVVPYHRAFTYMFEMVSPYNKVVVPHMEVDIRFIGMRENTPPYREYNKYDIGIPKPKTYKLNSLDECIKTFEELDFKTEGYVIVDKDFNRIKVKNPAYLAIHNLRGEGVVSLKRALFLIVNNDHQEFLSYFPEYNDIFEDLEKKYKDFLFHINMEIKEVFGDMEFSDRKDFALYVTKNTIMPGLFFSILDGKYTLENWEDAIKALPSDKLLMYVQKENK